MNLCQRTIAVCHRPLVVRTLGTTFRAPVTPCIPRRPGTDRPSQPGHRRTVKATDDGPSAYVVKDQQSIEGVVFDEDSNAWIASWTTTRGPEQLIRVSTCFPVAEHGYLEATALAERVRRAALAGGATQLQLPSSSYNGHAKHSSGVPGVTWHGSENRWKATWRDAHGARHGRSFNVAIYGFEAAKQKAIDARKEAERLGAHVRESKAEHKSAVRGVSYASSSNSWMATWVDAEGKRKLKPFSVRKYGLEGARQLAEQARLEAEHGRKHA